MNVDDTESFMDDYAKRLIHSAWFHALWTLEKKLKHLLTLRRSFWCDSYPKLCRCCVQLRYFLKTGKTRERWCIFTKDGVYVCPMGKRSQRRMNIVVTSPKGADLTHKVKKPWDSFWSLKRRPKKLRVGDIVWVVKNGRVVGGFYVRMIVHAKNPVKHASGHNPPDCWRLWFSDTVPDNELERFGVIDKKGEPLIKIRGFQGFRYQWWKEKAESLVWEESET